MRERPIVNKYDRTIEDYYEQLYELFPDVPKHDIKYACRYGWNMLCKCHRNGADTLVMDQHFWSYIGFLQKDSIKWFLYYIKKLAIRLRYLYKKKKIEWDGYYYFGRNQKQYEEYLAQKKKRGRPKKYFTFSNVFLFKILDECKIKEYNCQYIFRIPVPIDFGFRYYKKELVTDSAELIITRDTQKFKDILVNNNNYEFL